MPSTTEPAAPPAAATHDDLLAALPRDLSERVRRCNAVSVGVEKPNGDFVLHWMHNAVRADDNPALNVSVEAANRLGLPLLVYHAVSERYPFASDRHHTFMLEGARDVSGQMERAGLPYAFHLQTPDDRRPHLRTLAERAALTVTDDMPTEPTLSWLRSLAAAAGKPVWAVDASCVVPMPLVKTEFNRAFAFRNKTSKLRKARVDSQWIPPEPEHTVDPHTLVEFSPLPIGEMDDAAIAAAIARCDIDHGVGPVPHTRGGTAAGRERWQAFASRLGRYDRDRNDALKPGVSRMSPYLHYGYVGPFELARDAAEAGKGGEKYLDELLIWRELAFAFCLHRPDHNELSALPDWARESLQKHASDPRPHLYDWETLARGTTESDFWNAAQHSLLVHGELHNNVRMTWAKALLEWTDGPERCLELLIDLNHRYALDGRDPASYGGLLWCLGQFDREFPPEKPITGLVRGRSVQSHARRLPPEDYAALTRRPLADELPRVAVVGAGVSGLIAARTLRDHGIAVELFDKGRRPGGRGCTRHYDDRRFDHALSSVVVHDRMSDAVRTRLDAWEDAGLMQRWDPEVVTLTGAEATVEPLEVGSYRLVFVPETEALARHLLDSTLPPVDDSEQPAGPLCRSEVLVERIEDGCIHTATETFGPFDQIIVAVPPENVGKIVSSDDGWAPGIVSMNPVWTTLLTLEHPVHAPGDNLAYRDHPRLCKAVREASKPGRPAVPCWTIHATPKWTRENLERDRDEVAAELAAAFLESIEAQSATIASAIGHRWRYGLNPNIDAATLQPVRESMQARGLVLAGDWTDDSGMESGGTPGWYGFENALRSGLAAAGVVLRAVQAGTAVRS